MATDVPPVPDAPPAVVETTALVVATAPLAVDRVPVVADAPVSVVVVPALVLGAVPLAAAPFEVSDSTGLEQAWCRKLSNPSNSTNDTDRYFTVTPSRRANHPSRFGERYARMALGKPQTVKGLNFCPRWRKVQVVLGRAGTA